MTEATEVEVTQAERLSAYEAYTTCYETVPNDAWMQALLNGKHDSDPQVQLLARHRVRALTQAGASLTAAQKAGPVGKYQLGDRVTKTKGSRWTGLVVGFYSTSLTPIGYAVESETERGSVQIYPESALAIAQAQEPE
jgi:hypothetical protein